MSGSDQEIRGFKSDTVKSWWRFHLGMILNTARKVVIEALNLVSKGMVKQRFVLNQGQPAEEKKEDE